MQEAKQSERDLVVLNIRLRVRAAPLGALLLLFALVPFLAGSASPAASQQNVVLAAGTPETVESAAVAIAAVHDEIVQQQVLAASDAAAQGGGPILFPELALPGTPGALGAPVAPGALGAPGFDGVVVAGSAGPVFGTTLLAGSMSGSMAGQAGFIRPVNAPETSGFGPRIHPLLGRAMFHTGLDLGAACGTPIRAAADGTVVYASTTPSWGNRIIIAHSATLKTAYGHQSKMIAKLGDVVKQGQVIGLVGTTGWSTGCHLHFDVILNNHYVDPAPYLGFAGSHASAIPFYAPAPGRSGSSPTTPVVKNPNPPVIDGDVPIPPASAKSATTKPPTKSASPTPSKTPKHTPSKTLKPTKTNTKPPVTLPPTTPPTTTPPSSTTPPTTTKPPTTTEPPATTTTTTPPATKTTTPPPTCPVTGTDTTVPSTAIDPTDPTDAPTCVASASSAADTAAKSIISTSQAVLDAASEIATD